MGTEWPILSHFKLHSCYCPIPYVEERVWKVPISCTVPIAVITSPFEGVIVKEVLQCGQSASVTMTVK